MTDTAEIVASAAPDDPFFGATLEAYFPTALHPYGEAMHGHRLRREIIATNLSNAIIDIAGPTFPTRLRRATGGRGRNPGSAHCRAGRGAGAADTGECTPGRCAQGAGPPPVSRPRP